MKKKKHIYKNVGPLLQRAKEVLYSNNVGLDQLLEFTDHSSYNNVFLSPPPNLHFVLTADQLNGLGIKVSGCDVLRFYYYGNVRHALLVWIMQRQYY